MALLQSIATNEAKAKRASAMMMMSIATAAAIIIGWIGFCIYRSIVGAAKPRAGAEAQAKRDLLEMVAQREALEAKAGAAETKTLVALLRGGSEGAKAQAALALRNLNFFGIDNEVKIAALVALVRGGNEGAKEQAARTLSNLACLNPDYRVTIAAAGAIEPLVALLRGGSAGVYVAASDALINLAFFNANNEVKIALAGGFWSMMRHDPIAFLCYLLFNGHLLTLYLYVAAAMALYGAAQGTPTTPWFWTTSLFFEPFFEYVFIDFAVILTLCVAVSLTLSVEVLGVLDCCRDTRTTQKKSLGDGLLGYARYTAWRAIPPAVCIAGTSLHGPSAAMAATAGVVALSLARVRPDPSSERNHTVEPSAPSQQPSAAAEEDGESCSVCMSRPRTMRFRPCGHAVCCELCTIKACEPSRQRLPCPACREAVAQLELRPAQSGSEGGEPPRMERMRTFLAVAQPDAQSYEGVEAFLQAMLDSADQEVAGAAVAALGSWGGEAEAEAEDEEDSDRRRALRPLWLRRQDSGI